jgi:hypothetical protein
LADSAPAQAVLASDNLRHDFGPKSTAEHVLYHWIVREVLRGTHFNPTVDGEIGRVAIRTNY